MAPTAVLSSYHTGVARLSCVKRAARSAFAQPVVQSCRARSRTVVRAELQDPLRNVSAAVDSFLRRYDVVSTGVGATVVTGYCVYVHGQDPFTALGITFTATVVALVANELLFNDRA